VKFAFSRPTKSPEELRELIDGFSGVGYQGLQLKAAQYMPYLDDPARFHAEWGRHVGVASGLISGGKLDDGGTALRKLFRFAGAVGTERIVFCHGVPRAEVDHDDIRRFAKVLSELGKEAQQLGVALSLHHHYNQPVMYRDDIAIFFDAADAGAVGLTIDTAHLVKSGIEDVAGVIREAHEHIDNFHLKDFANGEWRVLGHGAIDFSAIFAAIHEIGYDGWLCADEESGGDLINGMKECYDFMQRSTVRA
jgi:sugar phosphate isomerase/epimerase